MFSSRAGERGGPAEPSKRLSGAERAAQWNRVSASWSRTGGSAGKQHSRTTHIVVSEVRQRLVRRSKRVGSGRHLDAQAAGGRKQLLPVCAGVGGDALQRLFLKELASVVERRHVAQVDAGDGERPSPVERLERDRHEVSDGGENYGGVKWLRWPLVGAGGGCRAEGERELLSLFRTREHVDLRTLPDRNLSGDVCRRPEAVDAKAPKKGQVGSL